MGIFSSIMEKIFGHGSASAATPSTTAGGPTATPSGASGSPSGTPAQSSQAAAPRMSNVDVEAVLTSLAKTKGGGGNWRQSIVDLLKLLDLDSSLAARKELATELNVRAGADGSAEQNIALHRAVMAKLAENGGKVPDSLRH